MSDELVRRLRNKQSFGPGDWADLEAAADRIEALERENIQMRFALGYPMPVDLERHIIPENPFKCGTCAAKTDRIEELAREVERLLMGKHTVLWMEKYKTARREALEEAARLVERNWGTISVSAAGTELPSWPGMTSQLAAAIRALKEKE